ncbi:MAG: sugar phosphate isomerase/epimerase [Chloroflexota bacterium]|nr:sugar phosphate isomerase/epimerase [Chloroflexota bacterium]MDP6507535.1 sugar phosphate isomerase/epimerase [Chloroflexota bacterium]MDP6757277.1 sugar phosphate isomerase/epimerase [Chloroflexota bacterium]
MELAVQQNLAPGESLAEKLRNIQACGYQAVELNYPGVIDDVAGAKAALADSPLHPRTMCCTPGHDLAVLDDDPATRLTLFLRTLDLAADLDVETLVSVPVRGPLPEGVTEMEELDIYTAALHLLGQAAGERGLQIVIEPLIRYETHLINTLQDAAATAARANHPAIRILADFFHMNVEEADIAASIREHGDAIGHVHLADSNRLNPGRGHLDFAPGLRALVDAGYDGVMALECRIAGDPMDELRNTANFVRDLWD